MQRRTSPWFEQINTFPTNNNGTILSIRITSLKFSRQPHYYSSHRNVKSLHVVKLRTYWLDWANLWATILRLSYCYVPRSAVFRARSPPTGESRWMTLHDCPCLGLVSETGEGQVAVGWPFARRNFLIWFLILNLTS